MKKRKQRPYWQVVLHYRERVLKYPVNPLRENFKTYRAAFLDFLACQEERATFMVALYRVQPVDRSDPAFCYLTNSVTYTLLAGEEPCEK